MTKAAQPEVVYVRASWPKARYGLSHSTLHRRIKNGTFPAPRYLPGGQRRWLLADLLAWEAKHLGAPEVQS